MSAAIPQPHDLDDDLGAGVDDGDETVVVGRPVVVRRNAGLAAVIGAGASAIAIAYLWRASQSGALLDWALCAVMAVIAGFYLSALVDARTPLVVADDLGVRLRLGQQWRGLPWEAVERIVVQPRRGVVRDGRLLFAPRSLGRALDGLDGRGRRQARLNHRLYGAALAVPLGLTTRVTRPGAEAESEQPLADAVAALARGRADVVVQVPEAETAPALQAPARLQAPALDTDVPEARGSEARGSEARAVFDAPVFDAPAAPASDAPAPQPPEDPAEPLALRVPRRLVGNVGTIVSRVAKGRSHDVDRPDADAGPAAESPVSPAVPLRDTRRGRRAEVTIEGAAAHPAAMQEGRELHRPGRVDLVFEAVDDSRVRPISQPGQPVEPLVIDDFVPHPAYDPVIGPELAAARTRLGLTVDELAERTRIRPHVIESIEVDDFVPCGGDFYARGHLRTLARVLGKDAAPLLEQFDARYATAPINARRVFEAELATGMTGSMRRTAGGPSWGLLTGAVLSLVLVWGLVRLFATEPPEVLQPAPVLNGSAGVSRAYPDSAPAGKPVQVTLTASARPHPRGRARRRAAGGLRRRRPSGAPSRRRGHASGARAQDRPRVVGGAPRRARARQRGDLGHLGDAHAAPLSRPATRPATAGAEGRGGAGAVALGSPGATLTRHTRCGS